MLEKRTTITFDIPDSENVEAFKVVGQWYELSKLKVVGEQNEFIGPAVPLQKPDGAVTLALAVGNPAIGTRHVLLLAPELIQRFRADNDEALIFYGGFATPEVMTDVHREAGFLGFLYPADNPQQLIETVGTIDYSRPGDQRPRRPD